MGSLHHEPNGRGHADGQEPDGRMGGRPDAEHFVREALAHLVHEHCSAGVSRSGVRRPLASRTARGVRARSRIRCAAVRADIPRIEEPAMRQHGGTARRGRGQAAA